MTTAKKISFLHEKGKGVGDLLHRAREVEIGYEVFFDRGLHPVLSNEMRDAFPESGWYGVVAVHSEPSNVSYDVRTTSGVLERVCYTWFSTARKHH